MSRILVVDDERVIRELMREILAQAGYETIGAETAAEALTLLDDTDVSLVVSDIVMPGLTGLELLDEVRARRPTLPVILVTGAGTYENLSQAVTRGANGLVIKPFSHADLHDAVEAALERARRNRTCEVVSELRTGRGTRWDAGIVDVVVELLARGELDGRLGDDARSNGDLDDLAERVRRLLETA